MGYTDGSWSSTWKVSNSKFERKVLARLYYEVSETPTTYTVTVYGQECLYNDNLGTTIYGKLSLTNCGEVSGSRVYKYSSSKSNTKTNFYTISGPISYTYGKTTSSYTVYSSFKAYRTGHENDIYSVASASFTVPALVKGEITSAPNFNDTDNPWVGFSVPSGYSTLKLCIADSNASGVYVDYRDVSGGGYTFYLTEAERNVLRSKANQSNSITVSFVLRTTYGDSVMWSVVYRTLNITDATPNISASVWDSNESIVNITGDNQILVKGYSNVSWSLSSSAKKGAWINNNYAQYKDNNWNVVLEQYGTSGGWNAVSYGNFGFYTVDSRGNSNSVGRSLTVVDYFKPSLDIDLEVSSAGVMTIKPKGSYFNGDLGKTKNTMALTIKWRKSGDEWTELPVRSNFDEITIEGLDYTELYEVEASLRDTLEVVSVSKSIRSLPVFDWGKDEFNFNVPVTLTTPETGNSISLLDFVHPVGSVFISFVDFDIELRFGGKWERLPTARMLLSASGGTNEKTNVANSYEGFGICDSIGNWPVGETGGEHRHTLTEAEMPAHSGHLTDNDSNWGGNYHGFVDLNKIPTTYGNIGRGWNSQAGNELVPAGHSKGSGNSHSNMPPYIAAYMWKRIA